MAKYTLHMCFMSTPLHESLAMSDDTCYSIHRMRPFLHKEVSITGLLDERLIELLSQDARQSSQTLANQLNVSSSTVRRRISKLVKRGVLRFAALAEPSEFGFYLRAIIAFDVEHDKVREVMELLSGRSEVKGLAATSGRFDVIALVWFTSTDGLFEFIESEVSKMEGVRNGETFICLHVDKGF